MDGLHASSSFASFSFCDGSQNSIMEYISRYGDHLDARLFRTMRIVGDQTLIYDRRFHKYRDNVLGTEINRWRPCGGRHTSSSGCTHESMDPPFLQGYEEAECEYQLCPSIAVHRTVQDGLFPTSHSEAVGFSHLYDQLPFIPNWAQWVKDADFEYRKRSGEHCQYISG